MEETENLECGYMNVPLAGKWFEDAYGLWYDHIIHIDLDMTVINPIPQKYFRHNIPVTIGLSKNPAPTTAATIFAALNLLSFIFNYF